MRFSPRGHHRGDQEEDEDIFAEKPLEELLQARNDDIVGSRCPGEDGEFLDASKDDDIWSIYIYTGAFSFYINTFRQF